MRLLERDFSAAQRRAKAKSGAAMPDGSFPISTRQDLENALHLVGQARDPAAARAHIAKRAKAIGAEDLLHESLDPLVEATVAALFESAALQEANLLDLPEDELHQLIDDVLDRVSEAGAEGSDEEEADEDEAEEDDEETEHTGVMVALLVPEYDALRLAIPDHEAPEDLHLTLAYLGEADDLDEVAQARIVVALDSIARRTPPCEGDVSGLGRFQGEPGGQDVIYASVDALYLSQLREQLCQELCMVAGVEISSTHGFTPHITLAYVEVGAPAPVERVPSLHLEFDQMVVAFGDQQIPFDLEGSVAQPPGPGYMHEAFAAAHDLDGVALQEAFETATGGGGGGHQPLSAEHKAKISASLKARASGQSTPTPAAPAAPAAPASPAAPAVSAEDKRAAASKVAAADLAQRTATYNKAETAKAAALAAASKVGKPAPTKPAAPVTKAPPRPVQTSATARTAATAKATSAAKPRVAPPPAKSRNPSGKKQTVKEAAVPDTVELLESAVDLLEVWHTKGRHLSAAHKAAISASLKARAGGGGSAKNRNLQRAAKAGAERAGSRYPGGPKLQGGKRAGIADRVFANGKARLSKIGPASRPGSAKNLQAITKASAAKAGTGKKNKSPKEKNDIAKMRAALAGKTNYSGSGGSPSGRSMNTGVNHDAPRGRPINAGYNY